MSSVSASRHWSLSRIPQDLVGLGVSLVDSTGNHILFHIFSFLSFFSPSTSVILSLTRSHLYYLLRVQAQGFNVSGQKNTDLSGSFASEVNLPHTTKTLFDGYWALDHGNTEVGPPLPFITLIDIKEAQRSWQWPLLVIDRKPSPFLRTLQSSLRTRETLSQPLFAWAVQTWL